MLRPRSVLIAIGVCCTLSSLAHAQPPTWFRMWEETIYQPLGICLNQQGNLVEADTEADRVQIFAPDSTRLNIWGSSGSGPGQFAHPTDVAVGPSGNIYVMDQLNNRVQVFDATGAFLSAWTGDFLYPISLAVGPDETVYLVDFNNSRIMHFTATGTFIGMWGSNGSAPGQFNYPRDIAVDADGHVWVVEVQNNRVQKFAADGTYLTSWGEFGSGPGQFDAPFAIALDDVGHVYISDLHHYQVVKLDTTGQELARWGTFGDGPGQFYLCQCVAVSRDGNLVFTGESFNSRIQEFGTPELIGVRGEQLNVCTLAPPVPNPFRLNVQLNFSTAMAGPVTLNIYDLQGRSLRHWTWAGLSAGHHIQDWDGQTENGQSTPMGILFCRLETSGRILTRKMIRLP